MLHFVWQGHDVSKFGLCGQMDLAVFKLQDPMLPNNIAKRIQFFFAGRKSQNCNKSLDANFLRNRYEGLPESSFKLVNDGTEYHRLSDRRLGSFGCIKAFGALNPS